MKYYLFYLCEARSHKTNSSEDQIWIRRIATAKPSKSISMTGKFCLVYVWIQKPQPNPDLATYVSAVEKMSRRH